MFRFFKNRLFGQQILLEKHYALSPALGRKVKVSIYLPPRYREQSTKHYPTLFFNDGQDMQALGMVENLNMLYQKRAIPEIIVVAIHANNRRMDEYGMAYRADYMGRGALADAYSQFVTQELLPYILENYRMIPETKHTVIAGCSLGGLSALDIAWNNPLFFGKVGVFSGSFWWRSKPYTNDEADFQDRIAHDLILNNQKRDDLSFWLQTGTHDETDDRNHNGIIDSIDDTLDIIKCLKHIGYYENNIKYVEVAGGEHNPQTWNRVLPDFLKWAFG
jgi:enterochelin esterase-like enzyme